MAIDGDTLQGDLGGQYEALQNGGAGSGNPPPPCDWYPSGSTLTGGPSEEAVRNDEEPLQGELRWTLAQGSNYGSRYEDHPDDGTGEGTYYFYHCYLPDMPNGDPGRQQRRPPDIAGNCGAMGENSTLYVCYFDAINPENVALYAVDRFVEQLGRPVPRLNPEGMTLVNFDTWLWVEGDIPVDGQEFERMEVPGQWVETTGYVSGVDWNMGDGETRQCPITTDEASAQEHCSYRYERSSAGSGSDGQTFEGSAAIVWTIEYVGEFDGTPIVGEPLYVRFETPFEIQVAESQAIITR